MVKWKNLLQNRCPKCNKDTALAHPYRYLLESDTYVHACGFRITQELYKVIMSQRMTATLQAQLSASQYEGTDDNASRSDGPSLQPDSPGSSFFPD